LGSEPKVVKPLVVRPFEPLGICQRYNGAKNRGNALGAGYCIKRLAAYVVDGIIGYLRY
jgi:hypothetical protein